MPVTVASQKRERFQRVQLQYCPQSCPNSTSNPAKWLFIYFPILHPALVNMQLPQPLTTFFLYFFSGAVNALIIHIKVMLGSLSDVVML